MNIYINIVIFRTRGKHRKMFSAENIFRKNDLFENIFRQKPFYVEVNGAKDARAGRPISVYLSLLREKGDRSPFPS